MPRCPSRSAGRSSAPYLPEVVAGLAPTSDHRGRAPGVAGARGRRTRVVAGPRRSRGGADAPRARALPLHLGLHGKPQVRPPVDHQRAQQRPCHPAGAAHRHRRGGAGPPPAALLLRALRAAQPPRRRLHRGAHRPRAWCGPPSGSSCGSTGSPPCRTCRTATRCSTAVGFAERDLPTLRTLTQAGGRLDVEHATRLHRLMTDRGGAFWVMYGQTEATARLSVLPSDEFEALAGSVGRAIPGGSFEIVADGPSAPGRPGSIVYRGPNVMLGYADDRAGLGRGDDLGGVLVTGDEGRLDGDVLTVLGRRSRIAKVFGLRFGLDEVERAAADGRRGRGGRPRGRQCGGAVRRRPRSRRVRRARPARWRGRCACRLRGCAWSASTSCRAPRRARSPTPSSRAPRDRAAHRPRRAAHRQRLRRAAGRARGHPAAGAQRARPRTTLRRARRTAASSTPSVPPRRRPASPMSRGCR